MYIYIHTYVLALCGTYLSVIRQQIWQNSEESQHSKVKTQYLTSNPALYLSFYIFPYIFLNIYLSISIYASNMNITQSSFISAPLHISYRYNHRILDSYSNTNIYIHMYKYRQIGRYVRIYSGFGFMTSSNDVIIYDQPTKFTIMIIYCISDLIPTILIHTFDSIDRQKKQALVRTTINLYCVDNLKLHEDLLQLTLGDFECFHRLRSNTLLSVGPGPLHGNLHLARQFCCFTRQF